MNLGFQLKEQATPASRREDHRVLIKGGIDEVVERKPLAQRLVELVVGSKETPLPAEMSSALRTRYQRLERNEGYAGALNSMIERLRADQPRLLLDDENGAADLATNKAQLADAEEALGDVNRRIELIKGEIETERATEARLALEAQLAPLPGLVKDMFARQQAFMVKERELADDWLAYQGIEALAQRLSIIAEGAGRKDLTIHGITGYNTLGSMQSVVITDLRGSRICPMPHVTDAITGEARRVGDQGGAPALHAPRVAAKG